MRFIGVFIVLIEHTLSSLSSMAYTTVETGVQSSLLKKFMMAHADCESRPDVGSSKNRSSVG